MGYASSSTGTTAPQAGVAVTVPADRGPLAGVLTRDSVAALMVLAALGLVAILLLSIRLRLPIGPNHWDLYFVMDGAWRLQHGQTPHLDFFIPSGVLPYALSAAMQALFPSGHPLLTAQYAVLLITLPLMAVAVLQIGRDDRWRAVLVAAPFAILVLAPVNAQTFHTWPGSDGMGLYNRLANHLVYVAMVALVLMRDGPARAIVLGLMLAALFYTKINVALPVAALVAYAAVIGFVGWRTALGAAGLAVALILSVGLSQGWLTAYLSDIAAMVQHNSGSLITRVITLVSVRFEVVLPLAALCTALLLRDAPALLDDLRGFAANAAPGRFALLQRSLRRPGPWISACVAVAIALEAQNTGSQEFVFLWPALVAALLGGQNILGGQNLLDRQEPLLAARPGIARTAVLILVAAATLPTALAIVQRTARFIIAGVDYPAVSAPLLRGLDTGTIKDQNLAHARAAAALYANARDAFSAFAAAGQMPSPTYYSEPSFQALYLLDLDGAVGALKERERRRGRPFASVAVLDSVDMAAYALDRPPARGLAISLDIWRGLPRSRWPALLEGWRQSEALLLPHCPELPMRRELRELAAPVLAERRIEPLNPCWSIAVVGSAEPVKP
jgi:hypothetical protein